MNIALIKAGGVGSRMGTKIPKQFIKVYGKPIIIYTLEHFESHPDIDAIIVVCVDGWQKYLQKCAEDYHISKLVKIVTGGPTSLKSIYEGLKEINMMYSPDDIVIIHDGNRPMVTADIISSVIAGAKRHGSSVAAMICTDEVMETDGIHLESETYLDHKKLYCVQTPDAYHLKNVMDLFSRATDEQMNRLGATNVLMIELGETVYLSPGSAINIRLTTKEDILLFQTLYTLSNNIKGEHDYEKKLC